jgi:HD-like signal output (HDOD) protein
LRGNRTRRRRNWHQPKHLIRCAVEQYLEAVRRKRLEREPAAGYVANAAIDCRITEEFSAADYETFQ